MPKKETQSVTNAILDLKLTTLTQVVENGFSGVHRRQDEANGKLGKNTEDIIKLKSREWYVHALWFTVTALVGVVVYLIKL